LICIFFVDPGPVSQNGPFDLHIFVDPGPGSQNGPIDLNNFADPDPGSPNVANPDLKHYLRTLEKCVFLSFCGGGGGNERYLIY